MITSLAAGCRRCFTAVTLSFVAMFQPVVVSAGTQASPPPLIHWSQERITASIGNGPSPDPITLTFQSTTQLTDASIAVVPILAGLVVVEPSSFTRVEPNTPYVARIRDGATR